MTAPPVRILCRESTAPAAPPRPPTAGTSGTWDKRAACRDADPELFFPVSETGPHVEQAKAVCRGCPVRTDCLERAVRAGEPAGIWGGLTAPERRRLRAPQPERTTA